MAASHEETVRPINAPDGWVLLLTGRSEYIEMMAGRLRHEGLRVVTRRRPTGFGSRLGGGWQKELLVPLLAEQRARKLLEQPPMTVQAASETGGSTGWEPEVIDAQEGTLESVADLFDAAARLVRSPWSTAAAEDLARATSDMADRQPPYGFDAQLWATSAQTGSDLLTLVHDGASADSVSETAERLVTMLRDQV